MNTADAIEALATRIADTAHAEAADRTVVLAAADLAVTAAEAAHVAAKEARAAAEAAAAIAHADLVEARRERARVCASLNEGGVSFESLAQHLDLSRSRAQQLVEAGRKLLAEEDAGH